MNTSNFHHKHTYCAFGDRSYHTSHLFRLLSWLGVSITVMHGTQSAVDRPLCKTDICHYLKIHATFNNICEKLDFGLFPDVAVFVFNVSTVNKLCFLNAIFYINKLIHKIGGLQCPHKWIPKSSIA